MSAATLFPNRFSISESVPSVSSTISCRIPAAMTSSSERRRMSYEACIIQALSGNKLGKVPALCYQFIIAAILNDFTFIEHDYPVTLTDS